MQTFSSPTRCSRAVDRHGLGLLERLNNLEKRPACWRVWQLPHMDVYYEQHDLSDIDRTGLKVVWAIIHPTGVHGLPRGQRAMQSKRETRENNVRAKDQRLRRGLA